MARRPRRLAPITWRLVRFLIKGVAEGATVSSTRAPHTHLECDCGRRMLIAYVDLVARHTERRAPITLRFDSSTKASSKAPPRARLARRTRTSKLPRATHADRIRPPARVLSLETSATSLHSRSYPLPRGANLVDLPSGDDFELLSSMGSHGIGADKIRFPDLALSFSQRRSRGS